MKHTTLIVVILLGLALPITFNACGQDCIKDGTGSNVVCAMGTSTGNPLKPSGMASSRELVSPASDELLNAACSAIVKCNPSVSYTSCYVGVSVAPNVGHALGISNSAMQALGDIRYYSELGYLRVSSAALNTCKAKIAALSCSSAELSASYQPSQASPFAGVQAIFDPACRAVFSE